MEKRRGRREIEVTRRRRGGSKGKRTIQLVINSLFSLHSLVHSERFTELYREEKREEGDRGNQEERRGNQKGRDQSSQQCSLSVLHSLGQPERVTELNREEMGREEIGWLGGEQGESMGR